MAVQHANRGIVKNNLQLYYNREFAKSFRGQATTNLLTYTNTFDSSIWVGYCGPTTNITYNTTDVVDPFGGYNALKVTRNAVTSCGGAGAVAMGLLWNGTQFLVAAQTYTASFYARGAKGGESLLYGLNDTNFGGSTSLTTSWVRYSFTLTVASDLSRGLQFLNNQGNYDIYYIYGPQVENKSYKTPYILSTAANGSRSANTVAGGGGLLDISGNNYNIDLTSSAISFDSGGYYFNADASGALTTPVANSILDGLSNNTHTYEVWFKLLGTPPGASDGYFFGRQGFHEGFAHLKSSSNVIFALSWYYDNSNDLLSATLALNTWYHGVYVVNVETATRQLYINGSLVNSGTLTKQLKQYTSTTPYHLGAGSSSYASNSIVSAVRAYNKALSATEILQNFNATRTTYGI